MTHIWGLCCLPSSRLILPNSNLKKTAKLPNVGLLVGEDSEQEFSVAVGHVRLRHDDVVAGGKGEERHHLARDAVIRNVKGWLEVKIIIFSDFAQAK